MGKDDMKTQVFNWKRRELSWKWRQEEFQGSTVYMTDLYVAIKDSLEKNLMAWADVKYIKWKAGYKRSYAQYNLCF